MHSEVGNRVVARSSRFKWKLGRYWLEPLAAFFDGVAIVSSGVLAIYTYQVFVLDVHFHQVELDQFLGLSSLAAVLFVLISKASGAYEAYIYADAAHRIARTLAIWGGVVCILTALAFLLKVGGFFSRGSSVVFVVSGALALVCHRAIWKRGIDFLLARNLLFVTNALVVRIKAPPAESSPMPEVKRQLSLRRNGIYPLQQIILPLDNDDKRVRDAISYIQSEVAAGRVDEILLALDHNDLDRLAEVGSLMRAVPVPVRFIMDEVTQDIASRPTKRIGSLMLTEFQRAPLSVGERGVKRLMDVIFAVVAIVLLSPLMLMAAILVKIDSRGPVFFFQNRRGFSGKEFRIIKFRSMTSMDNGHEVVQATLNDQRVTRVGRVLRRTSIDELPQLWNVLKGDMSIVGPRPHAIAHDDYYSRFIAEYAFRHHTKPGITGLAQVNGLRGETPEIRDMRDRVEMDVSYINSWSIWLDVKIIVRTALVVLWQRKAY